jgi:outer membrane receptor protein involved in Fe transport
MRFSRKRLLAFVSPFAVCMASGAVAQDQVSPASGAAGEIIVTANKREQSINDVGLTIQAASSEALDNRGIREVGDLSKLVAGFTAAQSVFSTPVYTLRGIGLYDGTVGAAPAVAIYTDQIPRNFPVMSDGLELDVERVEVLKGPQGTLFGQSSTGGAINYIVGRPTDHFTAGFGASYERFSRADISGYVSGPLSDNLRARLAVRAITGGAWQYSVTRPDDRNGDTRKIMGRLSLDWTPTETIQIQGSLTGGRDRSDPQAPQYSGTLYNVYSAASFAAANANPATINPFGYVDELLYAQLTTPGSPGYRADLIANQNTAVTRMNGVGSINAYRPEVAAGSLALLGTPVVRNIRGADWSPGFLRRNDDRYWQATLRADIELSDSITFTTISAFAKKKFNHTLDLDATSADAVNFPSFGDLKTFNQEVRLSGKINRLNWIIGANFDHLKTSDNNDYILHDYVVNDPLNWGVTGIGPIQDTHNLFDTKMKTWAGFANAEFQATDNITISGGIRYTKNNQSAAYCYSDISAEQRGSAIFTAFSQAFGAPSSFQVRPGDCFVLGDGTPGYPNGISVIDPIRVKQNEDNWSFRAGLNYKLNGGGLIYANISQGYKAGVFSNIGASVMSQYVPATQEKLISYEGGFKLPLAGNKLQINGSVFYYDYTDKQVRAKVQDAVWGLLERLINVPKSRVWGLEGELAARPIDGLILSGSATYIDSKVTKSFSQFNNSPVYNTLGFTGDLKGSELPFTPNFMANADIQYEWEMGNIRPFIGGTFVYQGSSNATFENEVLRADFFKIPSWKTVDLRAGFSSSDGSWKFSIYGRNVFNERIITAPTYFLDAYFNMTAKPVVYGASVSWKY